VTAKCAWEDSNLRPTA